jgi:hypothetical protein
MTYRELQKKLKKIRDDYKVELKVSLSDSKEILEQEYRRVGHYG